MARHPAAPDEKKKHRFNYLCMCFIAFFNLGLVVVLRILLDSVNEFDEKVVRGQTRYYLETFLFYFATTFFFFCCGCFCCAGDCCEWISGCFRGINTYFYNMIIKSNQRPSAEAYRQQQEAIDNANFCHPQRIVYDQRTQQISIIERPTSLSIAPPISRMSQQSNPKFVVSQVKIV